jgi:hypothetical protein
LSMHLKIGTTVTAKDTEELHGYHLCQLKVASLFSVSAT